MCDDEILGKDHTLKFIFVTKWKNKVRNMFISKKLILNNSILFKELPIKLYFRPKLVF